MIKEIVKSHRFFVSIAFTLVFIALLYGIHFTALQMGWAADMRHLGIYPRRYFGFLGIYCAPLIHVSTKHLYTNTIPLAILLLNLVYQLGYKSLRMLLFMWLCGGLFVFIAGRNGWHLGASGLVFPLLSFEISYGIMKRKWNMTYVAMMLLVLCTEMLLTLLPGAGTTNYSWEGHISGAVAGLLCCFVFRNY